MIDKDSNIRAIDTCDRPQTVSLITAIEDAIYEIAPGKMTPIEVLGCLDLIAKNFHSKNFNEDG